MDPAYFTYTDEQIAALLALEHLGDGDQCTEFSCPYHGERNQARATLRKLRESGKVPASSQGKANDASS